MATNEQGWKLNAEVNDQAIRDAEKLTAKWLSEFKQINDVMSGTKLNGNLKQDLSGTTSKLNEADRATKSLKDNISITGDKGADSAQKIEKAVEKTHEETDKATASNQKFQRSINAVGDKAEHSFNAASGSVSKFSSSTSEATDKTKLLGTTTEDTSTKFSKLQDIGSKLSSVGVAIAAAFVPVAAAFKQANKEATNLSNTYTQIKNLLNTGGMSARASRQMAGRIRRENRRLSDRYGVSQNDLAAGSKELIKRGYTGNQDLGAHKYFLQASLASGDSYNQVVGSLAPALEQFGLKERAGNSRRLLGRYTKQVGNMMAYGADVTSTSFGDLGEALKFVGQTAHSNNQSVAETIAALGDLSNGGLEGTMAGTSLRKIINSFTSPSAVASKLLTKDTGLTTRDFVNSRGQLRPLQQDFGILENAMDRRHMSSSARANLFHQFFGATGQEGAQYLSEHYRQFGNDARGVARQANGNYIGSLSSKNMDTLQQQQKIFNTRLKNVEMSLAKTLAPRLAQMLKVANGILDAFLKLPAPIKKATAYLAGGVGALTTGWVGKNLLSKGASWLTNGKVGDESGGDSLLKRVITRGWNLGKEGIGSRIGSGALTGAVMGTGQIISAVKDRHNANARSQDIGGAVGSVAGGALTSMIPVVGPLLAPVGALVGKYAGRWGGRAVNNFTKGWQSKRPPKRFWSMENLGWSTKNMFSSFGKGWTSFWGGMGTWRKKTSKSIGDWFSSTGKSAQRSWNSGIKWIQSTPAKIGNWAAKTGRNIHKGWDSAIKASHNFWKSLPKNTSNFVKSSQKNIGKFNSYVGGKLKAFGKTAQKDWNGTWKNINANRYVKAFKRGQLIQTGIKDMRSRFNSFDTWFGKKWNSTWRAASGYVSKSWKGIQTSWDSLWTAIPKKWNAFKSSFAKGWNSFWGGLGNGIKAFGKSVVNIYNATIGKLQAFGKWAHQSWVGGSNRLKAFGNDLSYAAGGSKHTFKYSKMPSHATGGLMATSHLALVGEAGPELAYKPGANSVRLLGANGPEFTKVRSGERIAPAHQTAKMLNGGLGRGLILKGYANGTGSIAKSSDKAAKTTIKNYKDLDTKSVKSLKDLSKNSQSTWRGITSHTGRQTNLTRKNTVFSYKNMRSGVTKQMSAMHDGVTKQMDAMHDGVISSAKATSKGFGNAMGKMDNYAHSAMSNTIGQLNKGIHAVDSVISQFGGNATTIKTAKFATGTDANGRLTQNTLAMVNDATEGPRQEALISPENKLYFPHGDNLTLMLSKGWGILNGRQTEKVAKKAGIKHFANGSGVKALKPLYKEAEHYVKKPEQTLNDLYRFDKGGVRGVYTSLDPAMFNKSKTKAQDWWSTLWSMAAKKLDSDDDGPASGLLKAVEKLGRGTKYSQARRYGPDSYDCSGLVSKAMNEYYHKNWGALTVAGLWPHAHRISRSQARPGDPIFWLPNYHVGVYAGGNRYWSAFSPSARPQVGMHSISESVPGVQPTFARFNNTNTTGSKSSRVTVKANTALEKQIRGQVGQGFWSMMKKLGDEFGSGGNYGNPGGEGVKRWRKYIIRAAHQMHANATGTDIDKILSMISGESSGNPMITQQIQDVNSANGTPAQGLLQFVPSTFSAFAAKGHGKLKNGYDQLLALFNDSNWKNDIHYGGGWGPTGHRRYATGGHHVGRTPFLAGENGPELITADGPVKIDTHEETKRKVSDLSNLFSKVGDRKAVSAPRNKRPVTINININGPISSKQDAEKVGDIIDRKLEDMLERIGDEFGLDPSVY